MHSTNNHAAVSLAIMSESPSALYVMGTQVHVSDGTKKPLARHVNKMRDWLAHNYEGVIVQCTGSTYTVQRKPARGWLFDGHWLLAFACGVPESALLPISDAPALPVLNDGIHAMVDVQAMRREATV